MRHAAGHFLDRLSVLACSFLSFGTSCESSSRHSTMLMAFQLWVEYGLLSTQPAIRWPLLARGTKAAGFGLVHFLTISGHCFSAIRLCFYVFRGPKYPGICTLQIQVSRSSFSQKIASCSSLFSRLKNSEKRLPRNIKNRSPNSLKTISMKSRFLQYLL